MTDYITRANRFIHEIAPFIIAADTVAKVIDCVAEYNERYHRAVQVAHGATRIALITSDYVVKFNYGDGLCEFGGCEEEEEFYSYACEEGYGEYFAEITGTTVSGRKFWIMPRVRGVGRTWLCDKVIPRIVYDWVIDHVYDLHMGNFGMLNGHAVIIDYALNTLNDPQLRERTPSPSPSPSSSLPF